MTNTFVLRTSNMFPEYYTLAILHVVTGTFKHTGFPVITFHYYHSDFADKIYEYIFKLPFNISNLNINKKSI